MIAGLDFLIDLDQRFARCTALSSGAQSIESASTLSLDLRELPPNKFTGNGLPDVKCTKFGDDNNKLTLNTPFHDHFFNLCMVTVIAEAFLLGDQDLASIPTLTPSVVVFYTLVGMYSL